MPSQTLALEDRVQDGRITCRHRSLLIRRTPRSAARVHRLRCPRALHLVVIRPARLQHVVYALSWRLLATHASFAWDERSHRSASNSHASRPTTVASSGREITQTSMLRRATSAI